VLMLRGAQTPGELKQRTERLHPVGDLSAVIATLERLIDRELAVRLPRRPGQKEERYAHLLDDGADEAEAPAPAWAAPPPAVHDDLEAAPAPVAAAPDPRVGRLEAEVAALRADLDALRASVDALRADLGA
jgi:uncharacterized protein